MMRTLAEGLARGLTLAVASFQAGFDAGRASSADDIARAERAADYWYLRARYTEAELREMYLRASSGDEPAPFDHPGHPAELERTRDWAARGDERKEQRNGTAAA